MAEFLSPGVFIQELKADQQAVPAVSTSTYATVGWTPRGEENKAILVGSLAEYFRLFGSYWKNSDVPLAITSFFKNDGARAYVVRVVPEDAVAAQSIIPTNKWLIKALSRGAWGNQVRLVMAGNSNNYDVPTATYSKFDIQIQEESEDGLGDWEVTETFEAVDLSDPDDVSYFPQVLNDESTGSGTVRIEEVSGGIPLMFASTSVSGEFLDSGVSGVSQTVSGVLAQPTVAKNTFELTIDGVVHAKDNGKGAIKKIASSTFVDITGTINYTTGAVNVTLTAAPDSGASIAANYYKKGADSQAYELSGGIDGTSVGRSDVSEPSLVEDKKGLYALDEVDEILNIGLPDFSGDELVHQDLIDYCEGRKDCFAIIDPPVGSDAQDAINYKAITLNSMSSYAAMYWPLIKVADPLKDNRPKTISNVGHIAGVYARTDNNRNVGKAPAGVDDGRLNFLLGLERKTTKAERDTVYPRNINPLIDTPQTGRAVWGARTMQIVGDFNLVNVRRLFMFLEKSLYNASQDLVFEPLGEELFSRVKLRFDGFLGGLAGLGYFASPVPEEAFRVTSDSTNNTPDTIAKRLLIVDVLIAAQNPAEFILLRFKRSLNTIQ